MPLTISLTRHTADRAEAHHGDQLLGAFDPRALLVDQPLHPSHPVPADPVSYGQRLAAALGGPTFAVLVTALPRAPNPLSAITFETADPDLAAIPWEYLHCGSEFLILDYLFVRQVPDADLPAAPDPAAHWRLVALGSDPLLAEVRDPATHLLKGYEPLRRLQVVHDLDGLRDRLRSQQPPAPVQWQRLAPTRSALIDLATVDPVLFHYTGHGDVVDGQPILCFDDGAGRMDPQPVTDLARNLRGRVYFAFLNACRTADATEPGANLALALVQGGIPVVLGSQYNVLDSTAAAFASTFYQQLAAGMAPAVALWRARLRLRETVRSDPRQWAIPALYLAAGFEWPRLAVPQHPLPSIEPPLLRTEALQAPAQFLGREREVVDLMTLFVQDGKQIVTIRGAGGMGKTALSSALAQRLRFHFSDGILALSLTLPGEHALLSAAAVRRQVAGMVGALANPVFEDPSAAEDQEQAIVTAAQGRALLLIFDNYETVLARLGRDAEPDPVADMSTAPAATTAATPDAQRAEADAVQQMVMRLANAGVHLLFTSRQSPVGLPGEQLYPPTQRGRQLPGIEERPGAELFRLHAGTERPHTELFPTRVAAAVGYSPLGIQLAARRWTQVQQTEDEFLQRIEDELMQAVYAGLPEHQRSAIVNVRLSVDALSPTLCESLLALSIVGNPLIQPIHGAVLWGMEDDKSWLGDQAHARLEQLQHRSLLQGVEHDEERNRARAYTLQPVIAQVLRRLAAEVDLSAASARYAAWADAIVNRAFGEGGINYDEQVARETQAALPDLVAALPLLPDERRGWSAWRASTLFQRFGRPLETDALLDLAETTAHSTDDRRLLCRLRVVQGNQADRRGDLGRALTCYDEALAIARDLSDQMEEATILHAMAEVRETRGDLDGGLALYAQSLAINEALGNQQGQAAILHAMANVRVTRGNLDGALDLDAQSLAIHEALGDQRGKAGTLHEMANVRVTRSDLDGGLALYAQSLAINEALGDQQGQAATLHAMANVRVMRGNLDGALDLDAQSLVIIKTLGDQRGQAANLHQMAWVHQRQGDLDGALSLYAQSLAIKEVLGNQRGKAATLANMATMRVTQGDLDGALDLYAQSLTIHEALGDQQRKATTLSASSNIYMARAEWAAAAQALQAALALAQAVGDPAEVAYNTVKLGQVAQAGGDLIAALGHYHEGLTIFERLGMPRETAQVRELIAEVEQQAACSTPVNLSPQQMVVAVTRAVGNALQEQRPTADLQATLRQLRDQAIDDDAIAAYLATLEALIDGTSSAEALWDAAQPVLAIFAVADRRSLSLTLARLLDAVGATTLAIAAQEQAIALLRAEDDDRDTLVTLSVALYNLAGYFRDTERHHEAVTALEEVVALDERTGHDDLESDRAALQAARLAADPLSALCDAIAAWQNGPRDDSSLADLVSLICQVALDARRSVTSTPGMEVAAALDPLRAIHPLPIAGTDDFLHALQLWLRDDPATAAEQARLRATLPASFAAAFATMERAVSGSAEDEADDEAGQEQPDAAQVEAVLAGLSPDERAELAVMAQVAPLFRQAHEALHDPRVTAAERVRLAGQIDQMANQAAEGETPGSPWLAAAAALRALAAVLRGHEPDLSTLAPAYHTLLRQVRE